MNSSENRPPIRLTIERRMWDMWTTSRPQNSFTKLTIKHKVVQFYRVLLNNDLPNQCQNDVTSDDSDSDESSSNSPKSPTRIRICGPSPAEVVEFEASPEHFSPVISRSPAEVVEFEASPEHFSPIISPSPEYEGPYQDLHQQTQIYKNTIRQLFPRRKLNLRGYRIPKVAMDGADGGDGSGSGSETQYVSISPLEGSPSLETNYTLWSKPSQAAHISRLGHDTSENNVEQIRNQAPNPEAKQLWKELVLMKRYAFSWSSQSPPASSVHSNNTMVADLSEFGDLVEDGITPMESSTPMEIDSDSEIDMVYEGATSPNPSEEDLDILIITVDERDTLPSPELDRLGIRPIFVPPSTNFYNNSLGLY